MNSKITALAALLTLTFMFYGCSSTTNNLSSSEQQPSSQAVSAEPASSQSLNASTASVEAPQSPQPYVSESCWWTTNDSTGTYIHFAALLGNTDIENCYTMMPITITARSDDEKILATETFFITFIAPNDVMPYTGTLTTASEPAKVDFDLSFDPGQIPGHPYTLASFEITNDSEQVVSNFETRWTGEVTSHAGLDFPKGYYLYAMLYKDKKLVAGYNSYEPGVLNDGQTTPFSINASHVGEIPEHDSYKIYVVPDLLAAAAS